MEVETLTLLNPRIWDLELTQVFFRLTTAFDRAAASTDFSSTYVQTQ